MAFNGLSPDVVMRQGYDTWTVPLSNWGNLGATADVNSLTFPVAGTQAFTIPSCAAVAIGANSTASDCLVTYRLLDGTSAATVVNTQTRLSHDSPIVFAVSGPIRIDANNPVIVGDTYFKNAATVAVAFPASPVFLRPSLVLDFYLRRPTTIQPKRSPFSLQDTTVMVGGAETAAKILCVDGRRTVRVVTRVSGATATATIRVGLIYLGGAVAPGVESNMAAAVVGAVDGQVNTFSVENPHASLVAVYYNLTAGAGSLQWYIEMSD